MDKFWHPTIKRKKKERSKSGEGFLWRCTRLYEQIKVVRVWLGKKECTSRDKYSEQLFERQCLASLLGHNFPVASDLRFWLISVAIFFLAAKINKAKCFKSHFIFIPWNTKLMMFIYQYLTQFTIILRRVKY